MTKKSQNCLPVILSKSLLSYKLTKRHQDILERFEKVRAYMALARKKPEATRLSITDYADLNAAVQNQSGGRRSLLSVNYNGTPILSVEKSPQLDLLS